jgi:hypothetical protein
MSKGRKRVAVGVAGITAAVIGIAIAGHVGTDSNGGLKPYGLPETLPGMVSSFGSNARVSRSSSAPPASTTR